MSKSRPSGQGTDQPWYADGLRFRCTQCGNCCTGAPGYVWVNKEEIAQIAALLGMEVEELETQCVRKVGIRKSLVEFSNGDCVFFDGETRRCQVYSARPRQCRTWPFWDSNLRTEEQWAETGKHCPGCNKGQLYQLEEVQERADVLRL